MGCQWCKNRASGGEEISIQHENKPLQLLQSVTEPVPKEDEKNTLAKKRHSLTQNYVCKMNSGISFLSRNKGKPRDDIFDFIRNEEEQKASLRSIIHNFKDGSSQQSGDEEKGESFDIPIIIQGPSEEENVCSRKNSPKSSHKLSACNRSHMSNSSIGSIAFDPSCLVVENKSSIFTEYHFVDVLGKGAFGEVKKVMHKSSNKPYAMKVLNKGACSENINLLKEIEILKKLDHPNIVKLYEFAQDSRSYFLITEYCAGGELLNKIISMRNFTEPIAAKIMRQVLSALIHL